MGSPSAESTLLVAYAHAPAGTPLRPICGVPLCLRAALVAQRAGLTGVELLTRPEDEDAVRRLVQGEERLRIEVTVTHRPPTGTEGERIVALGDAVILDSALRAAAGALADGVAVRRLTADGAGKEDVAPIVRLRAPLLDGRSPEAVAEAVLGPAPATDGRTEDRKTPLAWHRIGEPADVRAAQRLLVRSLTKAADGVISRNINRRISGAITTRLAPHRVHPNAVTGVVALIGLASGPLAWSGTWLGVALAGLCYYVSAILDGVDGELSRLKFLASPLGAWLDTLTDDAVCASFLVGLFHGLALRSPAGPWGWLGVVALGSFAATVVPRYGLMLFKLGSGDHQGLTAPRSGEPGGAWSRIVDAVARTLFRTDFLPFFACVTAVAGIPEVFAVAFAAGSVLAAGETALTVVRFARPAAT